jgi:hypothetical protein
MWVGHATSDPALRGRAHVQSYISLAAIMWVRHIGRGDNYNADGLMSDAYTTFRTAFKENMTSSEWMAREDLDNPDARLWALYVGAYLEQAGDISSESADEGWYNVRLVRHARRMGLVTWEPVRGRLLSFLHTDVLQPHGSIWFPRIMEAHP